MIRYLCQNYGLKLLKHLVGFRGSLLMSMTTKAVKTQYFNVLQRGSVVDYQISTDRGVNHSQGWRVDSEG